MVKILLTSTRHAFVCGAAGYIGRILCNQLCEKGVEVRGGMRHVAQGPWNKAVLLDLTSPSLPEDLLTGVDTVFHLAGKAHALSENQQDEEEYFHINSEGTKLLLEAAKNAGVRRFVFISSVKAMGEGGDNLQDESEKCHPESPYGKSKLAAERLVLEGGYVPEPVVLRLSMVYGSTCKGNLPRMIEAIARGRFPPFPDIVNRRSMVHVDDVIQAALLAAEKPEAIGQIYIITDGQSYSTRQMYEWICETLNKPVPYLAMPISVLKILAKIGDIIGWVRKRRFMFDTDALDKLIGSANYSAEKIEQELGFSPQRDLHSALPEIVAHMKLK